MKNQVHILNSARGVNTVLTEEQFDLVIYALTELAERRLRLAGELHPGPELDALLKSHRRTEALISLLVS
jgi:hypothetical protein